MREFSISAGNFSVVGATTLVFVNPPAAPNVNIEFLRFWVGQAANATSAQQRITMINKVTAFPTLTAAVVTKLKTADPNASVIAGGTAGAAGTAGTNASAEGAGTATVRWEDAFNVLNGWLHVPTPPETVIYPAGSTAGFGLTFPTIPSTTSGWSAGLCFREQ